MKKCSVCQKKKLLKEFTKRKTARDGLSSACKICTRQRSKSHYERNKKYYIDKSRQANWNCMDQLWDFLQGKSCQDCGEEDLRVLEFDHLKDKKYNVSDMVKGGYGWEKIIKEIDKCEIVCSNCHSRRTMARSNSWRHKKWVHSVAVA